MPDPKLGLIRISKARWTRMGDLANPLLVRKPDNKGGWTYWFAAS